MAPYKLKPDTSFGWVLGTWVFLVAYVVFIVNVAVDVAPPRGSADNIVNSNREWELTAAADVGIDPCVRFAAHACAHSNIVHGHTVWSDTTAIAASRVAATAIYGECEAMGEFGEHTNVSIEEPDYSGDKPKDAGDETTPVGALLMGLSVNSVVARVGPNNGRHTLHVWHADSRFVHSVSAKSTCFYDYMIAAGVGHLADHTVIHSPNATCKLLAAATDGVSPPDYPATCQDVVRTFAMGQLLEALDTPHRAIADALAVKIASAMGVPNVTLNIGCGDVVTDDVFGDDAYFDNLYAGVDTPNIVYPPKDFVESMWSVRMADRVALVGTPVNASKWHADPAMVNAFYDPALNAIFIPQGILWPPFVSEHYGSALNLGGIGFIIAHELGHAIDTRDNDTALLSQVVKDVMALTNATHATAVVTEHEDIADYYGAKALDGMADLTTMSLLQFASLWCDTGDSFTGDVHAPGWVRTNEVVNHMDRWRAAHCNAR